MPKIQGTAADYLIAQLCAVGVRRIYGVAGTAIFPLLDAIRRNPEVSFIAATNELSAGYMAAYEARLTGSLGVCIATSGPGAVGLVSGVADAYFDGDPVLAITGQVKVGQIGTTTSQHFEQQTFFKPLTGLTKQVLDPVALTEVLPQAIGTALTERTAVHLTIPVDLIGKPVSIDQPAVQWYPLENLSGDLQATIQALGSFQKPLLILGKEAVFTVDRWLTLAERLGAGVIIAQEAKGLVPGDHQLNLGGIGETYLPALIHRADGIILIGSAPYEKPFLPNLPTVQITAKTMDLDWSLPLTAPLTGNLSFLANEIDRKLGERAANQEWLTQISVSREELRRQLTQEAETSSQPVHPSKLMSALSLHLAADAIISLDIGAFSYWFDKSFWAKQHTVLTSAYWRGIGSGLPGAIAAKLAFPNRQVLAVVGDGGLLLNPGELGTLTRYNLGVKVIVANTGNYELEEQKMAAMGMEPFGTTLLPVNLIQLAQAYGLKGKTVTETSEIDWVLTQILSDDEPVIVDVQCAKPQLPHPIPE